MENMDGFGSAGPNNSHTLNPPDFHFAEQYSYTNSKVEERERIKKKKKLMEKREKVVIEFKKQLRLAGPLILANVLQYLMQVISIMFVGHLGQQLALSAASMATSFANVTGFSLLMGMGTALDTLCGQAFGARQYHMLGIHMQRGMLVLTLVSIPIVIIWAFTGQILMLLHQDQQISVEAELYIRWMIPSLFGYGILQCHNRFLKSQRIVVPLMLSSGITTMLHTLVCWILVYKCGLGNKGAALANSISYWINALVLALYVRLSPKCKTTWTGFSREAVYDTLNFIKLAIPSAAMICLEFWSFELLVFLSGILPYPKLQTSVMSISLNTSSVVFTISLGFGAAISTRVSNELGAGNPQAVQLAIFIATSVIILEGLTIGLIMIFSRRIWANVYSSDREVVSNVAAMMPLVALSHLIDGTQCVLSGVARGCGWQKISAYVALGSYYIVGIPTSVVLAFILHLETKGLWIGIISALCIQDIFLLAITIRTKWENEVEKVRDRVSNSAIPRSTPIESIPEA